MSEIDFDYDLEEIVQMSGRGPMTLAGALRRMPNDISNMAMLHRDAGKSPSFFDAAQIRSLLDRHRAELEAGNPAGHREADQDDD